jgi:Flp pilus assembly protein TadG
MTPATRAPAATPVPAPVVTPDAGVVAAGTRTAGPSAPTPLPATRRPPPRPYQPRPRRPRPLSRQSGRRRGWRGDRTGPQPSRDGHAGAELGSASIEFAITAVVVMTVIFTAIQAATWFWARSIALAAAEEGATAARAYNAAPGAGQARAQAFIASTGDGLNDAHITVTASGDGVQVTVAGTCLSVLPGFCAAFPVTATAHGITEQVTTP